MRGARDQEGHYQCGKVHAGRHIGYEECEEKRTEIPECWEQEDTEPLATSEGNNVARNSFTGLGKKRGYLGGKVNGSGSPDTDSYDCVRNGTIC